VNHPKKLLPRLLETTECEPRITAVQTSREVKELFAIFRSEARESCREFLARVQSWQAAEGAAILCQTVVSSNERAPEFARYQPEWPVTWIEEDSPCAGQGFQSQVWAIQGPPVRSIRIGDRVCGTLFEEEDLQYLRLGGLLPRDTSTSPAEQTVQVFEQMREGLSQAGMTFRDVARTWYFNRDILSWYGEFNRTRNRFFQEAKVFEGVVPASTGIGAGNPAGAALTAGLLAVRLKHEDAKVVPVLSPLQNSALDYGSSFSRAVEIITPGSRRLLISGTASIGSSGETLHLGNDRGQIERTCDVVREILFSRNLDWTHVVRAHAFLRDRSALPHLAEFIEGSLPEVPVLISGQTVCRDDLLFEIEVDALVTT
jgi:enamine deaminase RidA (YjgF/YER057c/UK114 family)